MSCTDLRALDVETETREAAEVASPRGVLEADTRLMDSEASSSSSSSGQQAMPSLSSHWRAFFRLWRPKSMRRLVTFPPVGVPKLAKWRTSREGKQAAPSDPVEADLSLFRPSWMSFSISELQDATDNFNSDSKEKLDWGIRYKVAVGTAKGLEYLHEKCQRRIIHRDIKAANILLADDFEPQICDFGLAKWLPDQWTHHTVSSFEGTFGYLAPEYSMHGIVDEKTDVYAFGVLLLELITGRQALDTSRQSLVLWAKPMLEKNDTRGLLDPSIGHTTDSTQLSRAAYVASLCIQQSSISRPRMSQVLKLLNGEEELGPGQAKVGHGRLQRTFSEELFYADEYNATRYLSDLNRHRKVALGS